MDPATSKKEHLSSERRRDERFASAFSVVATKFGFNTENQESRGIAKNVSASGALLQGVFPFEEGSYVKLQIEFPGWEKYKLAFAKPNEVSTSSPFVALADVLRVSNKDVNAPREVAVRFASVDDGHQWALRSYLKARA